MKILERNNFLLKMNPELKILILGLGGQGVLFTGKVLAHSAFYDGFQSTFLPTYGPAVHNGKVKAEVIISEQVITNPFIEKANLLLLFHQFCLSDAWQMSSEDAVVFCKDFYPDNIPGKRKVFKINTEELVFPSPKNANILFVGVLSQYLKLFSDKAVGESLKTILFNKSHGLLSQNYRLFAQGKNLLLNEG